MLGHQGGPRPGGSDGLGETECENSSGCGFPAQLQTPLPLSPLTRSKIPHRPPALGRPTTRALGVAQAVGARGIPGYHQAAGLCHLNGGSIFVSRTMAAAEFPDPPPSHLVLIASPVPCWASGPHIPQGSGRPTSAVLDLSQAFLVSSRSRCSPDFVEGGGGEAPHKAVLLS